MVRTIYTKKTVRVGIILPKRFFFGEDNFTKKNLWENRALFCKKISREFRTAGILRENRTLLRENRSREIRSSKILRENKSLLRENRSREIRSSKILRENKSLLRENRLRENGLKSPAGE